MERNVQAGDVFRFGSPSDGWGYGQVLQSNILQYIVIFQPKFQNDVKLSDVVSSPPLLAGWTMDAKFQSGDWDLVGRVTPIEEFTYPEYKVEVSGESWVTDVNGNPLRLATAEEGRNLSYKSSNSPIAFEKAFKAHHGELPWEQRFNELQAS